MKGQEDIGAEVVTMTAIVIEIGIVTVIERRTGTGTGTVIVRGIGIAKESRTSIQGLEAEVRSQEGSLLVGNRTPSKHCIMAHIEAIMG
jgi:hypothetical protein